MRSSEVQNFNLFAIRNKKLNFFAFGNGLPSNAFRTTQSAHSAMECLFYFPGGNPGERGLREIYYNKALICKHRQRRNVTRFTSLTNHHHHH